MNIHFIYSNKYDGSLSRITLHDRNYSRVCTLTQTSLFDLLDASDCGSRLLKLAFNLALKFCHRFPSYVVCRWPLRTTDILVPPLQLYNICCSDVVVQPSYEHTSTSAISEPPVRSTAPDFHLSTMGSLVLPYSRVWDLTRAPTQNGRQPFLAAE
jgi:hypothetical protein